jgi:hypothetical protein
LIFPMVVRASKSGAKSPILGIVSVVFSIVLLV